MTTLDLDGCTPAPLGSYLKALGVLRLVAEQVDRAAHGWWRDDRFALATTLDEDALVDFFLDEYQPSPVVSPWNSDGGFSRSGKRLSETVLATIAASTGDRLTHYRETIAAAWRAVDDPRWESWDKRTRVQACRNRLPDEALDWLDTAVVLTDGDPVFPPILGTGGNLGRLELSSNYMQRLIDVLGIAAKRPPSRAQRRAWLEQALFGRGRPKLVGGNVGQYNPGQAIHGTVNPWDFVLLVEGALLFASGVARAAGSDGRSVAAMSFTVRSAPVGHGTAAVGESAKGEIWAPLWSHPTGLGQIRRLFREGRLRLGRDDARTGLDAARAAASLGVDRGVDSFARHVLVERFGQSIFAVPAGRLEVTERAEVSTLGMLDAWLRRVRAAGQLPAHAASALRAVEQAEYDVAAAGGSGRLLAVLGAIADLHVAVARSGRLRVDVPPITGMRATHWLAHITQDTPEFRLAAGFASLRGTDGQGLRHLLTPVTTTDRPTWTARPPAVPGFGVRSLVGVLADTHAARVVRLTQQRRASKASATGQTDTNGGHGGPRPIHEYGLAVRADDLAAFLAGQVNLAALETHLSALLLLDWTGTEPLPADEVGMLPADPAWRLLAPFYAGLARGNPTRPEDRLTPGPGWARQLQAGALAEVASDAVRRLRAAHLHPLVDPAAILFGRPDPRTLSAALLLRVSRPLAGKALRFCATDELPH
ncbi:MAG TPA: type I-U CRISPR-associated protein Csx17 [Mycobacteriales bacterium]